MSSSSSSSSPRRRVVLSFDVGIRNLAYALVRHEPTHGGDGGVRTFDGDGEDCARLRLRRCVASETRVLAHGTIDTTAYLDVPVPKNINKIAVAPLGRAVLRAIDADVEPVLDAHQDPTHVLIENQPCLSNPKMKTVQIILFTHILRRYLLAADAVGTPGGTPGTPGRGTSGVPPGRTSGTPSTVDVRMFQARDKLAVYDGPAVECALKSKYGRRKRLSVEYTRRLLDRRLASAPDDDETRVARASFDASRKQDDLADCYLQALTFIRRDAYPPPRKKRTKRTRARKKKKKTTATTDATVASSTADANGRLQSPVVVKRTLDLELGAASGDPCEAFPGQTMHNHHNHNHNNNTTVEKT